MANYTPIGYDYLKSLDYSTDNLILSNDLMLLSKKDDGSIYKPEPYNGYDSKKLLFKTLSDEVTGRLESKIDKNRRDIQDLSSHVVFLNKNQTIDGSKTFQKSCDFNNGCSFTGDSASYSFLSSVPTCPKSGKSSGSDIVNIDYLNQTKKSISFDWKNLTPITTWSNHSGHGSTDYSYINDNEKAKLLIVNTYIFGCSIWIHGTSKHRWHCNTDFNISFFLSSILYRKYYFLAAFDTGIGNIGNQGFPLIDTFSIYLGPQDTFSCKIDSDRWQGDIELKGFNITSNS